MSRDTDTIAAIATPHGKSALAVIRVSGPQAVEICGVCLREKALFEAANDRYIQIYTAIDPSTTMALDEVTAIKYHAPRSFTGEQMVEILCHGGPQVIRRIAEALHKAGARSALRGEFTRRALCNGKISLMRAEAIGGLIESHGEIELACAQKLYRGTSKEVLRWKSGLVELLVRLEAEIEFGEEDSVAAASGTGTMQLEGCISALEADLGKREKITLVGDRVRVVIAGPTNAGKSTLFNMLLGYGRAIVHEEPGTTRDLVSELVWIRGHEVLLIDSAGFRETGNVVEQEGILRSKSAMEDASVVIWVTSAGEEIGEWEENELRGLREQRLICVVNKCDLASVEAKAGFFKTINRCPLCVSLKSGENSDKILDAIAALSDELNAALEIPDIFLNRRQEEIGRALLGELFAARHSWARPEIAAHHLKNGISRLDDLLGRTDSEEVLDKIFENFCVGK